MNHADKLAIRVENVSKKYKLFPSNRARIREALDPWRRSFHHEFWALRDINFTVSRGHTVGIMGKGLGCNSKGLFRRTSSFTQGRSTRLIMSSSHSCPGAALTPAS